MHLWHEFLKSLEGDLGAANIKRWLFPLCIIKFDACNLYLEAKNSFQILWFEEHVRERAIQSFRNNSGKLIKVHLTLASDAVNHETASEVPLKANIAAPASKTAKQNKFKTANKLASSQKVAFTLNFDAIYPQATFATIAPIEMLDLPYKLLCHTTGYNATAAAEPELSVYNPIYLYGPKGTGKTHLLMAATAELRKKGFQALYVHAETFTEHVVAAIRAGEMSAFRQAYRNIDILLIDDVHLFSGRAATQEELFHTFNTLHVAGQQIILSAACAPSELVHIEPRLVSRFEWGISLPLQPLEEKELAAILNKKMETMQFPLHGTVVDFLLETFHDSKSLVQALEALILRSHMQKKVGIAFSSTQITLSQAKYYLNDLIRAYNENAVTAEKILESIGQAFGIRRDDILGKAKNREYVLPRQLAMYLCRKLLKLPFKKIGSLFNKDHSTVMASVKLIEEGITAGNEQICHPYNSLVRVL
jgi:chromosomal replication initiator protein